MTIEEAIRNNTVSSDFEAFKKFFELMGINYEIPADNLIYLSGFEVNSSQLIVIKFYEDGRFQEFCPYPEEGMAELIDLREENKVLTSECDRLIKEKGELLNKVSGGDVLRICQLEEQLQVELDNNHCLEIELKEAKRLLKAAVEDIHELLCDKKNLDGNGQSCNICSHIEWCPCCKECTIREDLRNWRYIDEALKLIGDESDGI